MPEFKTPDGPPRPSGPSSIPRNDIFGCFLSEQKRVASCEYSAHYTRNSLLASRYSIWVIFVPWRRFVVFFERYEADDVLLVERYELDFLRRTVVRHGGLRQRYELL